MTLICAHRVNQSEALATVDSGYGVEIDLHADGDRLVLVHDPFSTGEDFETWLDSYHHAFIVLNTKEEGLEARATAALEARGITEWAFLDQSFPYLIRTLRGGEARSMVRVSEYESIETALALPARPNWVWVDSFTGDWPDSEKLRRLHDHGLKLMIVSPELQGRDLDKEFTTIAARFVEAGVGIDGVCTKRPDMWHDKAAAWWT